MSHRDSLQSSCQKFELAVGTGPEERNFEWSGQTFQKMRGGASHRGHV